jgi:hypothetical protein
MMMMLTAAVKVVQNFDFVGIKNTKKIEEWMLTAAAVTT